MEFSMKYTEFDAISWIADSLVQIGPICFNCDKRLSRDHKGTYVCKPCEQDSNVHALLNGRHPNGEGAVLKTVSP